MNETGHAFSPPAAVPAGVTLERPVAENLGTTSLLAEILQNLDLQAWLFEAHLNRRNEK